jgi:hypothetical protein
VSDDKAMAADTPATNEIKLDRAKARELLEALIRDWKRDNTESKGGLYGAIERGEVPHIEMLMKALGRSTSPETMDSCHMSDEEVLGLLKINPLEKGSITGFGRAVAEAQRDLCARFVESGTIEGMGEEHDELRKGIADAMRTEKKA